ncbi:MAG: four helix bundle protein [Bacteroidetes bacterium]|jgi:four helix bundle protein|nr:four helix bundle protein [Bacteroidota bacterium]
MLEEKVYDLEDRLIEFAVFAMEIAEALPRSDSGKYLSGQMIRSGTSPALIYGEAQSAESKKDFIHKMKIALKELRETCINLNIVKKKGFQTLSINVHEALDEVNQLISIFVKSIQTARKNLI